MVKLECFQERTLEVTRGKGTDTIKIQVLKVKKGQ